MAGLINIPTRPSDMSRFKKIDKRICDVITAHVALSMPKHRAFALYYPEYLSTRVSAQGNTSLTALGEDICKQVFSNPMHQEYLEAYTTTLESFLKGCEVKAPEAPKEDAKSREARKERALENLLNQAMAMVESNPNLSEESLKNVSEIFKKVGLLKDEEVTYEPPRRYLPETCSRCRYKSFVEENIKQGNIVNEDD